MPRLEITGYREVVMAKVIILSPTFPKYHQRAGQRTHFIEKFVRSFKWIESLKGKGVHTDYPEFDYDLANSWNLAPKFHTIRAGHRWREGQWFSPRMWSASPYRSKQRIICIDLQIVKIYRFEIKSNGLYLDGKKIGLTAQEISMNDGFERYIDMLDWIQYPKDFEGQILFWVDPKYNY